VSTELADIKEYIYENDLVFDILESLGCEHIKLINGRWECQHDYISEWNKRAVQVKNQPTLSCAIRTKGLNMDIFGLIGYIEFKLDNENEWQSNLHKSKDWIFSTLNIGHLFKGKTFEKKQKTNPLDFLDEIKKRKTGIVDLNEVTPNEWLDDSILNDYIQVPNEVFENDYIPCWVQDYFEIGIDLWSKRYTIPIRSHTNGRIVSIKGRDMTDESDYKYLYLYNFNKSIELYGLLQNKDEILERNQIIIYEAEKSVLQSFGYGYGNGVAMSGSSLSPVQAQIIKNLSLDLEIVISMDSEKTVEDYLPIIKLFSNRNVSCTYNYDDLLDERESICDRGKEVFEKILENRVKIDTKLVDKYNK
jgi:DNA primase